MTNIISDSMKDLLQSLEIDPQTEAFCLDALTPSLLRELLYHFHISPRMEMDSEKLKEVLFLSAVYMEKFGEYQLSDVVVLFKDFQVVNVLTVDRKVALYNLDCEYPCCVCHFNVDDEGQGGKGLECSVCESWFHNECTNNPLTDEFYNYLTDSPDFIKICCPPCLKNGQVKRLYNQLSEIQREFKNEMTDIKKLIVDSPVHSPITTLQEFKDDVKCTIDSEIGSLKANLEAKIEALHNDTNCIHSMKANLSAMNDTLMNVTSSIQNVDKYFLTSNISNDIDQIKRSADITVDTLEGMTQYKEVIEQMNNNAGELQISLNGNMSSLCQSTERVLDKINSINALDINSLQTSLTTLTDTCKSQLTHASALSEAVQDVSEKVKGDILTENVVSQLATKISDKLDTSSATNAGQMIESEPKKYSAITVQSPLSGRPSISDLSRSPQLSGNSSVTSKRSETKSVPPPIQMDESKTISIGNIKDKDLIISSAKIKSQFNRCFPRMEIIHCKKSMNGFVLIELDTSDDAKKVIEQWKGDIFFNTSFNKEQPTEVTLLEDARAKAVIEDVDKDFTDDEITENIQQQFPHARARRFINKYGPTHCVLLTFKSKQDLDKANNSKVVIFDIPFRVRAYESRRTIVQCYNCYGFKHIAAHCRKKKVCPYCSQQHSEEDCLIKKDKVSGQYKCANCKGNHTSMDKNCEHYKQMLQNLSKVSNDQ